MTCWKLLVRNLLTGCKVKRYNMFEEKLSPCLCDIVIFAGRGKESSNTIVQPE